MRSLAPPAFRSFNSRRPGAKPARGPQRGGLVKSKNLGILIQVKPGFTNYQPHPSSLWPEVLLKGGGTKIDESKHNIFEKISKIEKLKN